MRCVEAPVVAEHRAIGDWPSSGSCTIHQGHPVMVGGTVRGSKHLVLAGHRACARVVWDVLVATVAFHDDQHEGGESSGSSGIDVKVLTMLLFVTEEKIVDSSGIPEGFIVGRVPLAGVTDQLVAAIDGYILDVSITSIGQHFSFLCSLLHIIIGIRTPGVGVCIGGGGRERERRVEYTVSK